MERTTVKLVAALLAGTLFGSGSVGMASQLQGSGECYDQEWRASVDARLQNLSNDVAVLLDRADRGGGR